MRPILSASCIVFWVMISLLPNCAAARSTVHAVWASLQGERTTALYYSAKSGEQWTPPALLPLPKGLHITPVIAADRKGTLWIAWIEQTETENILRYAVLRQGRMEQSGRVCQAGNEQSYAPAILIDQNDAPWLAWSAVKSGRLADIQTSRWNGSSWEKPLPAHAPNQAPDITPFLGLSAEKKLWVSWFGMSQAAGRYVRYRAELENGRWRQDKEGSSIEAAKNFLARQIRTEPFPDQAKGHLTGAFFAGLEQEIQSVSDQLAAFRHTGEQ